ncbi:MAG: FHA domain-containing protein, partial [Candidatus Binataceae bacterium]
VVMRALEQAVEKRPRSAQEMRDLLPTPIEGSRALVNRDAGADAGVSGGEQMATIVLDRPQVASRAAIPRILSSPKAKSKAAARAGTQRSLNLPIKPPARAAASATAKTQDLGLKAQASAVVAAKAPGAAPSKPRKLKTPDPPTVAAVPLRAPAGSTVESNATATRTESGGRLRSAVELAPDSSPAGAWLAVSGDAIRFALIGSRVVIGRQVGGPGQDAAEFARRNPGGDARGGVDVDLSRLRRGADRVSQRHAEIIKQGADYFIRDLGSLNGTYVAGRGRLGRDQLYKLRDRDEVVLGGAKLEFRKS